MGQREAFTAELFNLSAMAHRWASEHFAVRHRGFWFEKVVFAFFFGKSRFFGRKSCLNFGEDLFFCFLFWDHQPVFGRKNRLNFGETFFFGGGITSFWLDKTVWISVKTFFILEITCFRPEKTFQSNSRLIWPENLGQVLEQYFESGAMENFQNQNRPRLEKGWEPLLYRALVDRWAEGSPKSLFIVTWLKQM